MSSKFQKSFDYELTIREIETIIDQIENGTLSLEEVFEKFAIATSKLKDCEKFLRIGQEKMDLLIQILENNSDDLEF